MNRGTIDSLYRKYGPSVLRRARVILQDEHAAQDAMQEVFIRALRSGSQFRSDSSPMTWLYRITTNYCLNVRRNSSRRRELLRIQTPPPDSNQISPEDRQTVLELLQRVPTEIATIAVYYYIDEMKQQEIADLLDVSRRHVRDRLDAFRETARSAVEDATEVPT